MSKEEFKELCLKKTTTFNDLKKFCETTGFSNDPFCGKYIYQSGNMNLINRCKELLYYDVEFECIKGAARGKHIGLVKELWNHIKEDNEDLEIYLNYGISGASEAGSVEIFNFFKTEANFFGKNELEYAIYYAAKGKHLNIIEMATEILEQNPNLKISWNNCLRAACKSGDKSIIDFIIKKGGNFTENCLESAFKGGHIEIAKLIIDKVKINICEQPLKRYSIIYSLQGAGEYGHKHMLDFLTELGQKDLFYFYFGACAGGHLDILKLIPKEYQTSKNIFKMLKEACRRNHFYLVKFLITIGGEELLLILNKLSKDRRTNSAENIINYDMSEYIREFLIMNGLNSSLLLINFFHNPNDTDSEDSQRIQCDASFITKKYYTFLALKLKLKSLSRLQKEIKEVF